MGFGKAFFLQMKPKICLPPENYVAPGVHHGISCTFHWTFVGYPEPIGECVGSTQ
jgi:hypothetical protein